MLGPAKMDELRERRRHAFFYFSLIEKNTMFLIGIGMVWFS
jgi:hypothetical protein